jgi:hypothetical protein
LTTDTLGDTVASTEQDFGLAEDRATPAQLLPVRGLSPASPGGAT